MAEPPKLLDRMRAAIRTRHYGRRTEEAYVGWVRRFIFFHGKKHPAAMGRRGERISQSSRCRAKSECVDPVPGSVRTRLSVSARAGGSAAVDGRDRARATP